MKKYKITDIIEDEFGCEGPVSYTHLDVYKRQPVESMRQRLP